MKFFLVLPLLVGVYLGFPGWATTNSDAVLFKKPLSFAPDFRRTTHVPVNRGLPPRFLHSKGRNQFFSSRQPTKIKSPIGLMRYNNQNVLMFNVLSSDTNESPIYSPSKKNRADLVQQQKASDLVEKRFEKQDKENEKLSSSLHKSSS